MSDTATAAPTSYLLNGIEGPPSGGGGLGSSSLTVSPRERKSRGRPRLARRTSTVRRGASPRRCVGGRAGLPALVAHRRRIHRSAAGGLRRDFQPLHIDFGVPVEAHAPADLARFTALYVDLR